MTEQAQTQQEEISITLVLPVSQLNTILAALNEIPHKFSRSIIDEIHKQADQQIPKS